MRILAVIPARGGSKGVPRKNLKPLLGKPLIAWTIEAAKNANPALKVIVSTEDPEIAEVSKKWGAEVPFLRPKELSTDRAHTLPVVQHAIREMAAQGFDTEWVMLLQPTTPLRSSSRIEEAIALQEKTGCDSVVSVVDVGGNHPYRMKKLLSENRLENFVDQGFEDMRPRQELPPVYIREGSIYFAKRSLVMEKGTLVGGDVRGIIIPSDEASNIDTMEDFERAEMKLKKRAETP